MRIFSKLLLAAATLCLCTAFAACTSDDKEQNEPLSPLFAEPLTLRCDVDAVKEIQFSPGTEWLMTSGAIWCKISTDGDNFAHNVSGTSADCKVYVKIGEEAQTFEETTTTLTIIRNGVSEVIANIYRGARGYELWITDADGNRAEAIEINSKGEVSFSVEANFPFGVSEKPDWIDVFTVTPDAAIPNKKNIHAVVGEEYEPLPCTATVSFFNRDGNVEYPYVISYEGMNPTSIEIKGENPWGWSLSSDANTFSCVNSLSGDSIKYEGAVSYTVKTFKYDCRYLFFEERDSLLKLLQPDESWIQVVTDASKVTVSGSPYPEETEGERKGYLLAVPAALYDKVMSVYEQVQDLSFIDSTYNNVMMEVTQVSDYVDLTAGFTVKHNMVDNIECFEESDAANLQMLKEKYSVEQVYAVSVDAGTYISAFPHLTDRHWEGWNPENTIVLDVDGNRVDPQTVDLEIGMDAADNYYISLRAQVKPVIIVLKGVNGKYIKALVVKSGITLDPGTGFNVLYKMVQSVPCALETDMELAAYIIDKYGTREIYSVTERVGRTLQIFPHLNETQWEGWNRTSMIIADTEGNIIKPEDVSLEVAMNDKDEYYTSIIVKKKILILVFVGIDGKNIKTLVIKPQQ